MSKISGVTVSFRLGGDNLNPLAVTEALGLTPTHAFAKGEPFPERPHLRRRTGVWILESTLPETAELDLHLQALLDRLDAKAPAILELGRAGYSADFYCGLFLDHDNEGVEIDPQTLRRMGAIGATLALDIYTILPKESSDEPLVRVP